MFENKSALETLIMSDSKASEAEKRVVVDALNGRLRCEAEEGERKAVKGEWKNCEVVSFREAARLLGYKSARSVYAAVRNRRLAGYYGGANSERATGVLTSSIERRLASGRAGMGNYR